MLGQQMPEPLKNNRSTLLFYVASRVCPRDRHSRLLLIAFLLILKIAQILAYIKMCQQIELSKSKKKMVTNFCVSH